jgi:hypothetical protein
MMFAIRQPLPCHPDEGGIFLEYRFNLVSFSHRALRCIAVVFRIHY